MRAMYKQGNAKAEREHFWTANPMAHAFEPLKWWRVERLIFAEDCGGEEAPGGDGAEDRESATLHDRTWDLNSLTSFHLVVIK